MSAYLLGNLIGRLALSYALIWILMFLTLSRLSWRDAFRRSNHLSGLIATMTLFFIGLMTAQTHGAGA